MTFSFLTTHNLHPHITLPVCLYHCFDRHVKYFVTIQVDELKQEEAQKKEELEKARTVVLDCPMCGKSLKTESVGIL